MDMPPATPQLFLEGQSARIAYNNVSIPGKTGTRFSLKEATGSGPWTRARITFLKPLGERRGLRFVYAPFEISGMGSLSQPVSFKDTVFAAGTPTEGKYRFNSYRVSWFKRDPKPRGELRYGVTLKVRDANIALAQGSVRRNEYNLGVVPLIYLGGERRFSDRLTGYFDFDGLAAPQGRAFDIGVSLGYQVSASTDITLGLRTLEGGANNKEVYNFTRINYLSAGIVQRF